MALELNAVGLRSGQIVEWPFNAPGNFVAYAGPLTIINTIADLPTPVAGQITLASGFYRFDAPVSLGLNSLVAASGTVVTMEGIAPGAALSGAGPILIVQSGCTFQGRFLAFSGGNTQVQIDNAFPSQCLFLGCWFGLGNTGAIVQSGNPFFNGCRFGNLTTGIRVQAGVTSIVGSNFFSMSDGIAPAGGSIEVDNCQFGSAANGIDVAGVAAGQYMQVVGSRFDGMLNGILGIAGTQSAQIIGNRFTGVTNGINWPAASIPTTGLNSIGNSLDGGTLHVGFIKTDARVNMKGNMQNGALIGETAIVP